MPATSPLRAWVLLIAFCAAISFAADAPRPGAGPGASREEVEASYGPPKGGSKLGPREVLNYPQGHIALENGRVDRVDFSVGATTAGARPAEAATAAARRKNWNARVDDAVREAGRRQVRIVALATGSDWSVASAALLEGPAPQAELTEALSADFVLLWLDFPMHAPASAEQRAQNAAWRERHGVTVFPAVLILSPGGEKLAAVDLVDLPPGDSFPGQTLAAIRETIDRLEGRQPVRVQPAPRPPASGPIVAPTEITLGLKTAQWLLVRALGIGVVIAGVLFWIIWWVRPWAMPGPRRQIPEGIAVAASGVPSATDIAGWRKRKLCAVVAGLAEVDNYRTSLPTAGTGRDIFLMREGEMRPHGVVCCAPGSAGAVPLARLREFVALRTNEGAPLGWFVAAGGFADEARKYATQHGVVTIDRQELVARLIDLPPLMLANVLAREE